jgi:glycogen debranching enzyme
MILITPKNVTKTDLLKEYSSARLIVDAEQRTWKVDKKTESEKTVMSDAKPVENKSIVFNAQKVTEAFSQAANSLVSSVQDKIVEAENKQIAVAAELEKKMNSLAQKINDMDLIVSSLRNFLLGLKTSVEKEKI